MLGKWSENCSNINVFCVFNKILRFEEGYYRSEICDWWYSNVPGIIWKTAPLKSGKYGIFPVLSLIFYLSLPKIRHFHPNEKYCFEFSKTKAIISESFNMSPLKLWLWQVFENGLVFLVKLCQTNSQNHLSNKWLLWKENKKIFSSFNISASLKSTPNTLQNFKSEG